MFFIILPPQKETNDSIFPPPVCTASKLSRARKWSIPKSEFFFKKRFRINAYEV